MKIIFLDIDGVLNSAMWSEHVAKNREEYYGVYIPEWQDINAINMLERFIKNNDIKLVISSSWRLNTVEETKKDFKRYDYIRRLNPYIIGVTPYKDSRHRGEEIKAYLDEHPEIDNWVIVDDDTDILPEQTYRFVWINNYYGLRNGDLINVENILNLWESKKDR